MGSLLSGFGSAQIGTGYAGSAAVSSSGTFGTGDRQGVDVTQLQQGDTFQGEIVSVNGEDVQIRLTNGEYMAARLERDVQIAIGQLLNLQVQSNKDNKIVLKPVYDGRMQMLRVGEAALRAAHMAVSDRNITLVSTLLENGMSINKNTLMAFNRLALQNPGVGVDDLIKLNKLQLPVNENTVTQLHNYQGVEHRLLDGIREASEEILKLYDTLTGDVQAKDGANRNAAVLPTADARAAVENGGKFMEQVLTLLSEGGESQGGSAVNSNSNTASMQDGSNVQNNQAVQNGQNAQDNQTVQNGQNVQDNQAVQNGQNAQDNQAVQNGQNAQDNQTVQNGPNVQGNQTVQNGPNVQESQNKHNGQDAQEGQNIHNGQGSQNSRNIQGEQNAQNVQNIQNGQNAQNNKSAPDGQSVRSSENMTGVSENGATGILKNEAQVRHDKSALDAVLSRLQGERPQELPNKIISILRENGRSGKLDIGDLKRLLMDSDIGRQLTAEQKAVIFRSEPFKAMLKDGLLKQWTLRPQDLAQEGKVEEFYQRLASESRQLARMMNDAMQAGGHGGHASQARAMSNISENVEFMNQMNQVFNYVQLPLKFGNSQAHGDLYVYTNKKNLARNDGLLTAFLHLDMDNLGSLDVSISLQTEKNQITTKFYLDEDSIALVEGHIDELAQRLAKKGYKCKNMVLEKNDDKTVLEHMEEQVAAGNAVLGYRTFDTRA